MAKKKLNFEQSLNRLEEIVEKMQNSEISLDNSLELYKEGIELSLFCSDSLSIIEKEVTELQKSSEGFIKKSFDVVE